MLEGMVGSGLGLGIARRWGVFLEGEGLACGHTAVTYSSHQSGSMDTNCRGYQVNEQVEAFAPDRPATYIPVRAQRCLCRSFHGARRSRQP